MATMKDVAAMAGVSFTTVSHVVNRTRPVSDAVRKKVEDAIAQLHYVPSAVARSLKVRTTSIIGLLVPAVLYYLVARRKATRQAPARMILPADPGAFERPAHGA